MFGSRNIPSVGEIQLSWVPNPPISVPPPASSTDQPSAGVDVDAKPGPDEDTMMDSDAAEQDLSRGKEGNGVGSAPGNLNPAADVDYDVAEDDESWGVA